MALDYLQNLLAILKAAGVEYYKSEQVELYLRPQQVPVKLHDDTKQVSPEIPAVFKRLNPNYSNPALWGK